MKFLSADNMTGGYGRGADIIHDCTITVEKGEIAVVVGPNGAGKIYGHEGRFRYVEFAPGIRCSRRRGYHPPGATGAGWHRHGICAADEQYIRFHDGAGKP